MINGLSFTEYLTTYGKTEEYSWDELAKEYNFVSGHAARGVWRRVKSGSKRKPTIIEKIQGKDIVKEAETAHYVAVLEDMITSFTEDVKNGEAELKAQFSEEIKTLEELITKTNIDTSIWEITKYVQNYWGNCKNPHWQVKAWLNKKKINSVDTLINFFNNYTSKYIPIQKEDILINNKLSKPVCVLISLGDPHIDKVEISGTSIDTKCKQYLDVLENLLYKSYQSNNIDEIVYVLGNDFFTSDSYWGTTTALTPQNVTDDFDTAYEKGFKLAIDAINLLKQFCNKLNIIYIPGNHDRTKSFYLVHALSVYFQGDKNIVFDRTADNTKAYQYGNTGIFFHHGDTPFSSLPLYMATKYREMWGKVKYSEISLADKHHKKEWKMGINNVEVDGTRMFICPALTGPDKWHTDKRFDNSIQAGICRIYCKEAGKIGEWENRI